ncbi:MAG: surface-adhesin E family protein [bacterium]
MTSNTRSQLTHSHSLVVAALLVVAVTSPASAQKWKDIGKTASGNMVSVDPKSVKRAGNLVSATVRVVFTPPVKAARGMWASSKTIATFDCTRKYLAAKENVFYSDAASTKVVERNVNKLPGFGPALGGSLGGIAVDYLCKTP